MGISHRLPLIIHVSAFFFFRSLSSHVRSRALLLLFHLCAREGNQIQAFSESLAFFFFSIAFLILSGDTFITTATRNFPHTWTAEPTRSQLCKRKRRQPCSALKTILSGSVLSFEHGRLPHPSDDYTVVNRARRKTTPAMQLFEPLWRCTVSDAERVTHVARQRTS